MRQRGVTAGSSPLARGLRGQVLVGPVDLGIIPARAGFTGRYSHPNVCTWDHPRSRGVYWLSPFKAGPINGSSPLARGLLLLLQERRERLGDHPRSRGVYSLPEKSVFGTQGSSPLARGLLLVGVKDALALGIIPARAGFTSGTPSPIPTLSDHPRSRGVYAQGMPVRINIPGSSPLARGLQLVPKRVPGGTGIIPARAGFTPTVAGATGGDADHPRSRGVYRRRTQWGGRHPGSSPLARGLLNIHHVTA